MPSTAKGIYHNLKESKYTISNGEVVFYFSSKLYRDKFLTDYEQHRIVFDANAEKLLNENPLNLDTIADVTLYNKIEKRGFFVRLDRAKINFNDLYQYALRKMNEKISPEWVIR